jgi:hypothetical protein
MNDLEKSYTSEDSTIAVIMTKENEFSLNFTF